MASRGRTGVRIDSGVPGPRVEEVDGHLGGRQLGELTDQLQALGGRLAHPEQDPAAQLHARPRHVLARLVALVPGVGGDDLGEKGPGRLQVVVVPMDPAGGEALGLRPVEDPGGYRHVEPRRGLHHRNQFEQPAHGPFVRTAYGQHDAELAWHPAAAVCRAASRTCSVSRKGVARTGVSNRDDWAQKWQSSGHPPGLGGQDALDLDGFTAPGQAHLMGQGGQGRHQGVGHGGELGQLLGAEALVAADQLVAGRGDLGRGRREQARLGIVGAGRPRGPNRANGPE